ncbi:MAG: VirB4-like conjugal transfer ATPase, CD1110 family [Christensenellales bacterium]
MAYVSIPKDLSRVKSKFLFNLTKRQVVCFGLGALTGVPAFFLAKDALGVSPSVLLMMLLMLPFFLLAMFERHGQPLEVLIRHFIQARFVRPRIRVWQNDNFYKTIDRSIRNQQEKRFFVANKEKIKLTRAEKRQLQALMRSRQQRKKPPHSVQETIPYERMWPDGICRVSPSYYTKTVQFWDINYQLAQNEDKSAIFEGWCDFLNAFDSSVHLQLSFLNLTANADAVEQRILLPDKADGFDAIRREYTEMLQNQLAKGSNGLSKRKYLTFGVKSENYRTAKPRLERMETDLLNHFKRLGAAAAPMDGRERLKLMYDMFHLDAQTPFLFDWKWLAPTGLRTKDFIVPSSFKFGERQRFGMGSKVSAVSFFSILASELNDRCLAEFLAMDSSLVVSFHLQAIDQTAAIKDIKHKLTALDQMKIDEQKKAVRAGYDMEILPSDLAAYGGEAKKLLEELQNRNERFFLATLLVMNTADNHHQLDLNVKQAQSIALQHNCQLIPLDYQQEAGMVSCLPLGENQIQIQRGLTTSAAAVFMPFTTQELCQNGAEALYYGLNALSNNLIMVDRKQLKNPNGLILGTPGSGKSFSAKREMSNVMLVTDDDVIICDPEGEYAPLVAQFGGQVIQISPTSSNYINPMEINLNYSDDDNPLSLKSDFILSLCELIVGGRDGLQPIEKTVIDRAVHIVYQPYLNDPQPENVPILEDLYNALRQQTEKEAQTLATALEIYVTGSLNVFNHRTNVDVNSRMVCYDIKELGKQLKKLGMLIVQDQVWGRVTANRSEGKSTRYYMDEFHLLLREEQTAAYSVEIWKRFRKWGGIPTGITQNVKDLLASQEVENILENSDFICMLNQASGDREILAKKLGISPYQLSYVTQSGEGEGLLFYGNVILPFQDHFPKNTMLYKVMTTKLSDKAVQNEH